MPNDRSAFIGFLLESNALQFGEFTLKSGRISPYFFNIARFRSGAMLARLGEFYGSAVQNIAPEATIVFGPAYKGIPLALTTAMALSQAGRMGRDMGYLFDRKEAKTHGDTGRFVGQTPGPEDRVVLVDDVITDGETKLAAVALLRATFACPIDAVVIAFNRQEQDAQGRDAVAAFSTTTDIPVAALLTLSELEAALAEPSLTLPPGAPEREAVLSSIRDYRSRYGVDSSDSA